MSEDLRVRVETAIDRLERDARIATSPTEQVRLKGKVEGVKLVLSYMQEEERMGQTHEHHWVTKRAGTYRTKPGAKGEPINGMVCSAIGCHAEFRNGKVVQGK